MDDTGGNIHNLIDISEELLFPDDALPPWD